MKKLLITAAVAAIAGVPAVTGLVGNASFAQSVPVQVPVGARTIDDHGRHIEVRDDRGQRAEPGDDRGRHAEGRDDRGVRSEPADDRGEVIGRGAATATRGRGGGQASGSVTTDDGGSRHGGHDDGSADR
jgi:hypothetical protein